MKKLLLGALCLTIVLAGCQKGTEQPNPTFNTLENATEGLYYFDQNTGLYQQINLDEFETPTSPTANKSTTSSAHGHFNRIAPGSTIGPSYLRFNATENSQGVSGSASYTTTHGEFLENSTTTKMDAECLLVEDNAAVFAGIVTSVKGDLAYGFPDGSKLYFYIKDNGNNSSTTPDQYNYVLIIDIFGTLPCDILPPSHIIWTLFGGLENVAPSEEITVR